MAPGPHTRLVRNPSTRVAAGWRRPFKFPLKFKIQPWAGVLLLTWATGLTAWAQYCGTCSAPVTGLFYWCDSPSLKEKTAVCQTCQKLPNRCFHCELPVLPPGHALGDGRVLCPKDARGAVTDKSEARRLFEETKREVFPVLEGLGSLPHRNITIELVDAEGVRQLHLQGGRSGSSTDVMGLTRTRRLPQSKFEHTIYLLSGLSRRRMMAVAAHEYAHTWVHENVPENRRLTVDTVEGFCEVVAYQVMARLGDEVEKKVILQNRYTQGQIRTLMTAGDQFRFYNLAQWMKTGVDSRLDDAAVMRVLNLQRRAPAPAAGFVKAVPTAVPDRLVLKGVSGTARRRFALINDQTMQPGESAKVRVGQSNVVVRCLDVQEQSVTLLVEGQAEPIRLEIDGVR